MHVLRQIDELIDAKMQAQALHPQADLEDLESLSCCSTVARQT